MRSPALTLTNFSYSYPGDRISGVRDVSVTISTGEFVVVCGESGGGKSTLLRAASGLVPHHFGGVVHGEAQIVGNDLRTSGPGPLAAVCGSVFQDPEVQTVMGRVRNEISFPLENLGWTADEIRVAVEETALVLGIGHLLDRRTNELSGGELQRVVLAAALAPRPPLLALDEPTSQLDPVAADDLIQTLARLNSDWGTTIMLVDHRFERALPFADRVLLVEAGRIAFDGPPREFLAAAAADRDRRWLLPPTAEICDRVGIEPLPLTTKEALGVIGRVERQIAEPARDEEALRSVQPALTLDSITHRYPDRPAPALDRVSLTFAPGTATALTGSNGSGKSTLLRIARGVQRADTGSVVAAGDVGLLLQNPNDYLIHERVADEAPEHALARFGLGRFSESDPRDLSGGERQRLALAIVMQVQPVALLLDEPTRGMDRQRRDELADELLGLVRDGVAVVVATHDAEFAARFADRVVMLSCGRVVADAPPRELLAEGWHFSTEIARLVPGSGALTVADAAELLGIDAASTSAHSESAVGGIS